MHREDDLEAFKTSPHVIQVSGGNADIYLDKSHNPLPAHDLMKHVFNIVRAGACA